VQSNVGAVPRVRHRVIVKFWDDDAVSDYGRIAGSRDEPQAALSRRLAERLPGVAVQRIFASVPPTRIRELTAQAAARDTSYRAPDFLSYFRVDCPTDPHIVCENLKRWEAVQNAYVDAAAVGPAVGFRDSPLELHQGYLGPAPAGIDVEFARQFRGGRGEGQDFVDLEEGWTLDHEAVAAHGATVLHGTICDDHRPHGTAVLSEVCGVGDAAGSVGIAPKLRSVKVVSHHGSTRANAMLAAIDRLPLGGVLLVEAQLLGLTVRGKTWPPVPIETLDADFDVIRLATALGITVVEAAGNGGTDLDTFENANGRRVINRDDPEFRDSGAIVVGAARSTTAHTRLHSSNYGSRIDCYAWGEHVATATSTFMAPFLTDAYTDSFSETSSAAPMIAGAALVLQGITEAAQEGRRLGAREMRSILSNPATGTSSSNPAVDRIGVMPDLRRILEHRRPKASH